MSTIFWLKKKTSAMTSHWLGAAQQKHGLPLYECDGKSRWTAARLPVIYATYTRSPERCIFMAATLFGWVPANGMWAGLMCASSMCAYKRFMLISPCLLDMHKYRNLGAMCWRTKDRRSLTHHLKKSHPPIRNTHLGHPLSEKVLLCF